MLIISLDCNNLWVHALYNFIITPVQDTPTPSHTIYRHTQTQTVSHTEKKGQLERQTNKTDG